MPAVKINADGLMVTIDCEMYANCDVKRWKGETGTALVVGRICEDVEGGWDAWLEKEKRMIRSCFFCSSLSDPPSPSWSLGPAFMFIEILLTTTTTQHNKRAFAYGMFCCFSSTQG